MYEPTFPLISLCFLGKAAGNDKKLLKHLEERFLPKSELKLSSSPDQDSAPGPPLIISSSGLNLKLFYYLVATMNQLFPDYDFAYSAPYSITLIRDVHQDVFRRAASLQAVKAEVSGTLFQMGLTSSTGKMAEFSEGMWARIDSAIELNEVDEEIWSFRPEEQALSDLDNPFSERGCV